METTVAKRPTVLVVDDTPDNLALMSELFRDLYRVQVAKSGEPHELQPMPPAERRVIHIALKEHPDVMSESIGEGAARRLIIKPRHG